jgi:hypothetical protein
VTLGYVNVTLLYHVSDAKSQVVTLITPMGGFMWPNNHNASFIWNSCDLGNITPKVHSQLGYTKRIVSLQNCLELQLWLIIMTCTIYKLFFFLISLNKNVH